jgi:hypothetical protein
MSIHRTDTAVRRLGAQYYAAARGAAWAGFLPVSGNLYHHSLEMFLKAGLSQQYCLEELKHRFGHRLIDLWSEFKARFPSATLSRFDTAVAEIEAFEDVRYPEEILKNGAEMTIEWGTTSARSCNPSSVPKYTLNVPEIDRLLAEIFRASLQLPLNYTLRLKQDVRAILARDNPVADQIIG